jgi:hypothetical protein
MTKVLPGALRLPVVTTRYPCRVPVPRRRMALGAPDENQGNSSRPSEIADYDAGIPLPPRDPTISG